MSDNLTDAAAAKKAGKEAGGLQTKAMHTWRKATLDRIREQKAASVSQSDLWLELSKDINVGQRKILSKMLADEFRPN
jgi:hypothetical protein